MFAAPSFQFTDDDKRAFAAALCKFVGKPWEAAVAVFGNTPNNTGKILYTATNWPTDVLVAGEMQRLLSTAKVGEHLASKEEAARQVWEWTQAEHHTLKDKVAAMQLYCEMREFVKKDAPPPMPAMPPIIQYVLDPDAGIANPPISSAA